MICGHRTTRGFSLVEVIVASAILSGAVVAICSISTRSFLGVKLNRGYERAWDMLDQRLTLIDYMGVDEFLRMGETSGMCESDPTEDVVHYWNAVIVEEAIPGLYVVDIAVSWQDGGRLRQVTARTRLNGAPVVEEKNEVPADPTQGQGQSQRGGASQGGSAPQGAAGGQGRGGAGAGGGAPQG
ncbi:MAG: prepilin-type N-terminal cleavage/methylation domain-containing protein, partial [Phycisphaerae bacterium]|nr:prepilin-type N-terminal cleavage/methylation domain-containing protein [Phycisphaerae bacterium]